MANIDLYGGDAQRIRDQYRTSLGRDASNDEVTGWLSGQYGGGGTNDWLNQIQTSGEAQSYKPPSGSQPPDNTQIGQQTGVSNTMPIAPPASADPNATQIADWYRQYLGRDPGNEDISKWLSGAYGWGGANNLSGIQRGIQTSEEASRRRAATPTTSYQSTPYTGFNTGGNDYSAFNTARLQDPGKSAKDAFAMISNQAPPPPFGSKAAMAQWFNTYIAPGMNALGHKVTSVSEDGFTYSNHEGTFFVDFGQNSGATAGSMLQRLQWNASPADDATRQRYSGAGSVPSTTPSAMPPSGAQRSAPSLATAPGMGTPESGYGEGGVTNPAYQGAGGPGWDDFAAQIQQAYQTYLGRPASQDEINGWWSGKFGYGSGAAGLPSFVSAIQNSPEAQTRRPATTTAPPPTAPTGPTGGGPGPQFSDPHTKYLEEMLQQMMALRMQPVNDPNRQMYEQMLKQRADSLGRLSPELDKQIAYLESRFKDLQGTGYTGAEGEAIRTGALDPIETDRQAARKRVMERLSARGLTPDSGIAQQALLEVDKAFDAMRGTTQTALTTNDLNRREDRKQRAETIRGTLSQIPEGRAREQLDVFGALNSLSQLARQEDEARQREAVGYGGALADLGPQRLQLAMQAAGMGGQPSSMFQNLMQLAGLNQNSAMYGANNQSQLWSGLGSIAAMLANSGR